MLRLLTVLALLLPGVARAADGYCGYGQQTAVLLVDRTTAFDETDKTLFLQALDGIVGGLGPGDRLDVYTMTGAYTESRKLFDRCKPACPDEGFLAGLMATCRPVLARSDYLGFMRELATTIAGLLRAPEDTPYSDLFRTVAEDVRASAEEGKPVRTVIMFTDLLENSPVLPEAQLRRLPPDQILRVLAKNGVAPSLPGGTVRVIGFGRSDAPGRPPLPQPVRQRVAEAWRGWFMAGGAATVDIGFR